LYFQESAWNTGLSANFFLPLGLRNLNLGLEAFHTRFDKQLLADVDADSRGSFFTECRVSLILRFYRLIFRTIFCGLQLGAALRLY
jgi:hypothetical protein